MIIANNDQENPDKVVGMPTDDAGTTVDIPVLMISHNEGARVLELGSGSPVVIAPPGSCARSQTGDCL